MKRILVLAWFYPPLNSSEAVVTEKLLGASRFSYDVFTQSGCEAWSYGRESDWPERANVRRICADAKSPEAWVDEALRFFLTHREDYALVMTRSMPPECHRVGLRIKALCPALPWVASFGDPIWRNPYDLLGGLYDPYSLANPLNHECALRPARQLLWSLRHREARRRARELAVIETQTLRRADRLIFNNVSELRYMNADPVRSVVIRHSFDRALIPTVSDEPRDRLRFVFTGQLNTLRCARPLLEALRRLRMDRPALPERAEFHFFGEMADADLAYILREGLDDFVRVHRPVSYRQSLAEAAGADWLLHIDAELFAVTAENPFFAGKLADYFGTGKPILALTMPRGDAADCLRRAGAVVLSFSVNEIKQALDRIIFGGFLPRTDAAFREGFSSQAVARSFDEQVVIPLLCPSNASEP